MRDTGDWFVIFAITAVVSLLGIMVFAVIHTETRIAEQGKQLRSELGVSDGVVEMQDLTGHTERVRLTVDPLTNCVYFTDGENGMTARINQDGSCVTVEQLSGN
jgi:hypothetical protein